MCGRKLPYACFPLLCGKFLQTNDASTNNNINDSNRDKFTNHRINSVQKLNLVLEFSWIASAARTHLQAAVFVVTGVINSLYMQKPERVT